MHRPLFVFLFCCISFCALAQQGRDEALALSYYQNAEYDKAAELYQGLWEQNNYADQYYRPLVNCLSQLRRFDELEKIIRRQIKKFDSNLNYVADLGFMFQQIPDEAKAKEQFEKILKQLPDNEAVIRNVAAFLEAYRVYNYQLAVLQRGEKLLKRDGLLSFDIARAHLNLGDVPAAVAGFLRCIEVNPAYLQPVKSKLQDSKDQAKLMAEMETQLYAQVQKNPNADDYVDLLTWIYIQNKDFESAIVQMKALDKRKNENGLRVLNIARMAQTEGFYDEAVSGYEYVVSKGKENSMYYSARTELLNCRKEKISKSLNHTRQDLQLLKADYQLFIRESGGGFRSAQSMKELADLEGFMLHEVDSAIELCEAIIKIPGITQALRNQTKLSLGDFYLINENPWDATLLYSQVDKEERDAPLGEEARFRNARLSYFQGDFEWAQTQLQVLKASTSELISNDAINLSVFIIDNSGLDTIYTPLEMFARAELFLFQNNDSLAQQTLDSIKARYPGHVLWDDIEYTEAQLLLKKRNYQAAIPLLDDVIKNYGKDLKGDDATFLLGEIYSDYLQNKEKAMDCFKSIIDNYSNSLLVIEARKRYRQLRGDAVE